MKNNFGEKAYKLDNTEIFQGIPVFIQIYKKKIFYEAKTDCLKTDYIEKRKFELTIIYKCTPPPPPYPGQRKLTFVRKILFGSFSQGFIMQCQVF